MSMSSDEFEYEYLNQIERTKLFLQKISDDELLSIFAETLSSLKKRFGKWNIAWGEINRFQRISPEINNVFSDEKASLPVGFASSAWGSLPSYASRVFPGTSKRYCIGGNSFVCAVEFGPRIKAKSLLAGGESGDPNSKHFKDQGEMYTKGIFKDVLFYKEDVVKHAERTYHP
jgi:acyl-homoserine-lactone acylase